MAEEDKHRYRREKDELLENNPEEVVGQQNQEDSYQEALFCIRYVFKREKASD